MNRLRWLMIFVLAAISGCEKPAAKPPAPQAASAPANAATQPIAAATTKPKFSFMTINGHTVPFPLARLRIDHKGSRVSALLFSADPKDAINANYDGNSFYLEMILDADDVDDLSGATWTFKSTTSERQDSPYGIFLHGHKQQLQPMEARAVFEGGAVPTSIRLAGRFMSYNDVENSPPDIVGIDAELPVDVIVKKE